MWMMPLHHHVNQKSDYDDDELKSVRQKWTAILCTTTFDHWETTICMPSFNPRK